jgi:hypothetical protein
METENKKNKKNLLIAFFVFVILFLFGFLLLSHFFESSTTVASSNIFYAPIPLQVSPNIKSVEIGGQNVKVDLALTGDEQTQGLSGRPSLAQNTGMLFVFNRPDKYLFWMKDMNFSIDMIWITTGMQVDYIEKNATPGSYPATYGPGENNGTAKYVLEVPSGFADQNNLKIGDIVHFTY